MKCRVPERQRVLNPLARGVIRRQLGDCAELTLAEVWGWGDKRLREIRKDVQAMYDHYDPMYPDAHDYIRALLSLFEREGGDVYPVRQGSGEKVLVGREHDIVYLCYIYQLRRRGYGVNRIELFSKELSTRIRYYNHTFDDAPGYVLEVIENRLESRGIRLGGDAR